jgi:hypothetical protein
MKCAELFHALGEAHHAYDTLDWQTSFAPIKTGDTLRVFHGFRDLHHAVDIAKHGTSGKLKADRVYSYEYDNNPHGLFITLSLKVATEFGKWVMEFNAKTDELQPPVWPGGSYTVQGQMERYFGHGNKGRLARQQAAQDAEARSASSQSPHVQQSDQKNLALMLTGTREHQALYVGDLSAHAITAFYVSPVPFHYKAPYERLSVAEFLARYGNETHRDDNDRKMFQPTEQFDPKMFLDRMALYLRDDDVTETFRSLWDDVVRSKNPKATFLSHLQNFLWPRQYGDAFRWMKRTFSGHIASDLPS